MIRTLLIAALLAPRLLFAQERGAVVLGESVAGLDVTTRVLVIAAHPDDEDTQLITWLARGRQVETGYLSLTRGDGGQNLIGNELGVMLGMIRTEELLSARRLDGGRQFFARAFDFGFSKTAEETLRHWPKDSLLRDVVTVVRVFRPQVIVAVFSGTPRDGHGHHQVSAILAREAYDAAGDTVRFPASSTLGLGPWSASKFYRASRFAPEGATTVFNVGELSTLRGRTYAEIASESRSQHLSQGFGILQRRGASLDYLTLLASRVGDTNARETSPLDGLASGWSRFRAPAAARADLDSLPAAITAVRTAQNLASPASMVRPLAHVAAVLTHARDNLGCPRTAIDAACRGTLGDLAVTLETAESRAKSALLAAAGVLVEATAPREQLAVRDTLPVTISVYNQGSGDVELEGGAAWSADESVPEGTHQRAVVRPDSVGRVGLSIVGKAPSVPWWLRIGRRGDVFELPGSGTSAAEYLAVGEERLSDTRARAYLRIAGVSVAVDAGPVVYRFADPARGEQRRPVTVVPGVSVAFDQEVEYARAGAPLNRAYTVRLHSASAAPRGVSVELRAAGLTVDTAVRRIAMEPFSDATLTFHVKGMYSAGRHVVAATASSGDEQFSSGFVPVQYAHIRPLRYYRSASVDVEAVDAALPRRPDVAYIRGVGDNVAPMLAQLGLNVTVLGPEQVAETDLSRFGSIVIGPRAFAASRSLVQQAPRLQEFARAGGTVVVQYGQQEIQAPGILPYPVTLRQTAERVTEEDAPVTILDARAGVMASPNRITMDDFQHWVQERSTYMPTAADPHYQRVLEMHDPGDARNENSLLVAPVGKGAYIYVTLALFRQLPAGVPGAARIFLNLIGADGRMASTLPQP
ncbi:MAG TPA: PIG-L family deacetylase [Gemmatimonadaceae bacterium]